MFTETGNDMFICLTETGNDMFICFTETIHELLHVLLKQEMNCLYVFF